MLEFIPVKDFSGLDENQLIEQLKLICRKKEKKFVEIWPERSAQVFHHLAKIYRQRSPDKIALIKCCGLLNSAISRKPSNSFIIEADLVELCQHVLSICEEQLAEQEVNTEANLVEKTTEVKNMLKTLREKTNELLKAVSRIEDIESPFLEILEKKKISSMEHIQDEITKDYIEIMAVIGKFCEETLGEAPCKYGVIGMGSLARNEITPFSDFEHIIVVEDGVERIKYLDYFQWFTVIFNIVILNLQETVIPNLYISGLNKPTELHGDWFFDSYTTNGVSFDSMMPHSSKYPLGKQETTKNKPFTTELIKPVQEMLEYLSLEADLKNGYHLSDILTRVCFVCGSKEIQSDFKQGVFKHWQKNSSLLSLVGRKRLFKNDLDKFFVRSNLSTLKSLANVNIKFLAYRTSTLFLSALGKEYGCESFSCFDIVKHLVKRGYFKEELEHKLMYVVAIACEIRLRLYMQNRCQKDCVSNEENYAVETLINLVGKWSAINYFQISYCLQMKVAQHYSFEILHYVYPELYNILICYALQEHRLVESMFENLARNCDVRHLQKGTSPMQTTDDKFRMENCLHLLEMNLRKSHVDSKNLVSSDSSSNEVKNKNTNSLYLLGKQLYREHWFDEALEIFHLYVSDDPAVFSDEVHLENFVNAINIMSFSIIKKQQNEADLKFLRLPFDSSKHKCTLTVNSTGSSNLANVYSSLGVISYMQHDYDKSLSYFKSSLEVEEFHLVDLDCNENVACTLRNIGLCFMQTENFDEALPYLKRSLSFYSRISLDANFDVKVAVLHSDVAVCLLHKRNEEEWMNHVEKLLNISRNSFDHRPLLTSFQGMANLQNESREQMPSQYPPVDYSSIFETTTLTNALNCTGQSLEEMKSFKEAIYCFTLSTSLYTPIRNKLLLANVKLSLAKCYLQLRCFSEAQSCLPSREFDYFSHKHYVFNAERCKTMGFAKAGDINNYFIFVAEIQYYNQFTKAIEWNEKISFVENRDEEIARLHHYVGITLLIEGQYKDALEHFEMCYDYFSNSFELPALQHHMGMCHMYTGRRTDALQCFKTSLQIYLKLSENLKTNRDFAFLLFSIARTLLQYQDTSEEGIVFLDKSLEVYFKVQPQKRDQKLLRIFIEMSDCLLRSDTKIQSVRCLIRALDIYQWIILEGEEFDEAFSNGIYYRAVWMRDDFLDKPNERKTKTYRQFFKHEALPKNNDPTQIADKFFEIRNTLLAYIPSQV